MPRLNRKAVAPAPCPRLTVSFTPSPPLADRCQPGTAAGNGFRAATTFPTLYLAARPAETPPGSARCLRSRGWKMWPVNQLLAPRRLLCSPARLLISSRGSPSLATRLENVPGPSTSCAAAIAALPARPPTSPGRPAFLPRRTANDMVPAIPSKSCRI